MPYAGFWRRFAAAIIDSIVLNILLSPLMGLMMMGTTRFTEASFTGMTEAEAFAMIMPMLTMAIVASIIGFILQIVYFAYMESSKYQATLGKMALGIVVTDTEGNRISFGRAAGRNLGKIVSGLILMIGYLMAAFTGKKQALHDLMAGTLVMKKDAATVGAGSISAAPSQQAYRPYEQEKKDREYIPERYEDDTKRQ